MTSVAAASPVRLRHAEEAAHQARGRLAETAPVAPALASLTSAPEVQRLAIKPPRRYVCRVGELESILQRATLEEVFFLRMFLRRFGHVILRKKSLFPAAHFSCAGLFDPVH
jgi:hypothetical protein